MFLFLLMIVCNTGISVTLEESRRIYSQNKALKK